MINITADSSDSRGNVIGDEGDSSFGKTSCTCSHPDVEHCDADRLGKRYRDEFLLLQGLCNYESGSITKASNRLV
jgi:hypothetical protein